jgi:hypothetical protein
MNTQPLSDERHKAVDRYRTNWQDEIDSAALYRALATAESQPHLAALVQQQQVDTASASIGRPDLLAAL